ncbi:SMR family transporter, partial [Mesorhizobium sp.]|uniref:DMT family transporter n=1 Tax=Mesorhizobium sp. TaxID=1871066 RepID=UPI0025BC112D
MPNAAGVLLIGVQNSLYRYREDDLASPKPGRDDPPPQTSSIRCSIDGAFAMSWIFLFFAGLFEIGWAIGLKYTDGFSKP